MRFYKVCWMQCCAVYKLLFITKIIIFLYRWLLNVNKMINTTFILTVNFWIVHIALVKIAINANFVKLYIPKKRVISKVFTLIFFFIIKLIDLCSISLPVKTIFFVFFYDHVSFFFFFFWGGDINSSLNFYFVVEILFLF